MAETKITFWKTDKRKKRSYKDLKFSLEEVKSEFQLLQTLGETINDQAEKNKAVERALKDSFLIHFRRIHNFLYASEPDQQIIAAEDFFETRDEWLTARIKENQVIKETAQFADKETLSLSYGKGKAFQNETFLKIVEEIEKVFTHFVTLTIPVESNSQEPEVLTISEESESPDTEANAAADKRYGAEDELYKVKLRRNGDLEVLVCHSNQSVRKVIQKNLDNPGYFLEHLEAYRTSDQRAKKWLAEVVTDYRQYFEENRVVFRLQ